MKRVRFTGNTIATAPHFEEHLLMELYCVRDHILAFFNVAVQALCRDFMEAFGPMYKEHRRIWFPDKGFLILYYCVRIYFRNYASFTSILLYRSANWALSYRTECEKLYRDIFERIYPGAAFDIDMIELFDIFFVLNFGEKRCLFG